MPRRRVLGYTLAMLEKPPAPPPDRCGCYIFRDSRGRPLYVGKARSLKQRVPNYFQANAPPRVRRLRREACDLDYVLTASEWEAFLLENNLIKQFKPRYNTLLKDDKTYPYLKLTLKDRYPRALVTRRIQKDGALYFGPFVPGWQAKKNLRILQEHFRVVTCRDPLDGSRPRPCLYYEMGQCYAPCIRNRVKPSFYESAVEEARLFLEGRTGALKRELGGRMKGAASRQDYETAAHYRDLLKALESLGKNQSVSRPGTGHWEYYALYGEGETHLLHGFVSVDGRVVDRKRFRFDEVIHPPGELFASALARLYANAPVVPDGVAVSMRFEGMEFLGRLLGQKKGRKVPVIHPKRGGRAALIRTLLENARLEFSQRVDPAVVLAPIRDILGLPGLPHRIECFDVSHSGGEETVASCVVWESGTFRKAEYRRFRVKTVAGVDDFASIGEVVGRRYASVARGGGALPDLVLIDGGPGQANAALRALRSVLPDPPPVAGLAKREERLFLPGNPEALALPRESPALHLLQQVRDEAHRFAVAYHRKRRMKSRKALPLLSVPGIGPVTAGKLLKAFLSTEEVLRASQPDLERAVGKAAAAKIRAWAKQREP